MAPTERALTRFSATAAPTPTLAVPEETPLALAVPPVVFSALTVSVPVAMIVSPSGMVASASLSAMFTPTAAATLTLPSEVLAEGVAASPFESPAPAESPSLSAKLRCWVFWLSVLPTVLPPSVPPPEPLSVGPPAALAMALAALEDEASAMNETPPAVASRLRSVLAVVRSLAIVTAIAAPTAALEPAAVPPEVVVVELVCVAVAESDPTVSVGSVPPLPTCAVVVLLASDSATAGLTATPPVEAAPASAVVLIVSSEVAASDVAPAPVITTLLASAASAVLLTMFRPREAPMPTEPPEAPPLAGMAETVELLSSSAVRLTAPPGVIVTVAPVLLDEPVLWPMVASLAALTRLIATAPATPTLEAPAPAVAVAPKVLGSSAPLLIHCWAPTVIAPALIVVL